MLRTSYISLLSLCKLLVIGGKLSLLRSLTICFLELRSFRILPLTLLGSLALEGGGSFLFLLGEGRIGFIGINCLSLNRIEYPCSKYR